MDDVVEASIAQPRFRMVLLGIFSALALLLSAIGLYGVLAYSVSQRIPELGVRVALGAQPREILALVVGHGLRLALIGIGIGLLITGLTSWSLSKLLFGVSALDALSLAGTCLLTLVMALAASSVPAFRALRVDPAVALRSE